MFHLILPLGGFSILKFSAQTIKFLFQSNDELRAHLLPILRCCDDDVEEIWKLTQHAVVAQWGPHTKVMAEQLACI